MPYPESCPECGGAFRNTGTHYTARRNEVGRHVLLELGCQNTSRRYWWDFTSGTSTEDSTTPGRRAIAAAPSLTTHQSNSSNGSLVSQPAHSAVASQPANGSLAKQQANGSLTSEKNGHSALATLEAPTISPSNATNGHHVADDIPAAGTSDLIVKPADKAPIESTTPSPVEQLAEAQTNEVPGPLPSVPPTLKEAFVRQLQLDRLTLRQMRSWLMADEPRRAMEVAAGATEATYERLALILFGVDLPQLLGKQPAPPPTPGMSAEERLELQREKARIRARVRRAAAKAARQP